MVQSKVATGWKDGSVRIFDIHDKDIQASKVLSTKLGLVHSLLFESESHDDRTNEEFIMRDPLVLNGHNNSSVTCLAFDENSNNGNPGGGGGGKGGASQLLASGSSDGRIILWDIIAETGLFRLIGHKGPITDLSFSYLQRQNDGSVRASDMVLISSSLDGLVKIWSIESQCCVQTIANHNGQVTCSSVVSLIHNPPNSEDSKNDGEKTVGYRSRFITGCIDGKVRVWSIHSSQRMVETSATTAGGMVSSEQNRITTESGIAGDDGATNQDDTCSYMGTLPLPPNTISNEKIQSIQYHTITDANYDETSFIGVLRSNTKHVDVYRIRSLSDTMKKKVRRLRRKREKNSVKEQKQKNEQDNNQSIGRGRKRGLLEDDEDEDNDENGDEVLGGADESKMEADEQSGRKEDYIKASDEFEYIATARSSHKIKAFTFTPHKNKSGSIRLVLSLSTNALETHSIAPRVRKDDENQTTASEYDTSLISTLDMYGHPTGIRSIALSSDDTFACTVSKNVAKVWNVEKRSCIRSLTLSSGKIKSKKASFYGLCVTFLPGDTHFVLGTREGHLLIVDIASGDIVYFEEKAHEKEIWSIDLKNPKPNNSMLENGENSSAITIMTGSADKSVKFWEIERQSNSSDDENDDEDYEIDAGSKVNQYQNHPMLVHVRTLQTTDDVVACRYSYDAAKRMVFVSTLDSQIKVFFDDTLKFFLSLYGHSLPALAIDASDDDVLLASGGADKSIKIWGLDFGDTHRTLYGHSDSITDLKFVKKTHNFFTCSKDMTVRYWDADRFEQILLLNGHSGEINCLSLSKTGAFVLSGGMDRQVRVWERTKDMVFLEEEKERELEAAFDNVDTKDDKGTEHILRARSRNEEGDEDDENEDNENLPQSEAAVRRSVLSISSGDRIMEALERADQELKDIALFNSSQKTKNVEDRTNRTPNIMLLGMEPPAYILWVLRSIKSTELEQSLLILPLSHIERLIYYLILLLRRGQGVEICSRAAICLIKSHQNQIIYGGSGSSGRKNSNMSIPLRELRRLLKVRLGEARDTVGYNLAAMRMVIRVANERKSQYHIPDHNANPADTNIWKGLDRL